MASSSTHRVILPIRFTDDETKEINKLCREDNALGLFRLVDEMAARNRVGVREVLSSIDIPLSMIHDGGPCTSEMLPENSVGWILGVADEYKAESEFYMNPS